MALTSEQKAQVRRANGFITLAVGLLNELKEDLEGNGDDVVFDLIDQLEALEEIEGALEDLAPSDDDT